MSRAVVDVGSVGRPCSFLASMSGRLLRSFHRGTPLRSRFGANESPPAGLEVAWPLAATEQFVE